MPKKKIFKASGEFRQSMGSTLTVSVDAGGKKVSDTLVDRGKRYGDFTGHAEITMRMKDVVREFDSNLNYVHKEVIDMILHKIGRILNGDPNYADSWHDIAGYATLAEQRCKS